MKEHKYRGPIYVMMILRMALGIFFLGFLLNNFFSPIIAFIALVGALAIYFILPKDLKIHYYNIENHFLRNLNDRELAKFKRRRSDLTPWDGHITYFDIAKESNIAGKTLEELQLRELMGINIAFIKRGEITINMPSRNERIFPGDEICVIGTDVQIEQFQNYLKQNEIEPSLNGIETEIVLRQFELINEEFTGKTIRQSQLREKTNGLIVGLERNGRRILNPDSHSILEKNDILWIVGDKKLLAKLFNI
jgi:monovalent cation:H+ antiporter-2, CPA2 family